MKVNQLRIGNWIYELKCLYRVKQSFFDQCDESDIEFIPLTEEWLLKFGFEVEFCFAEKANFKLGRPGNDFITGSWSVVYENNYVKIKYVHQLQNLYFALTGQELEIKE